MQHQSKAHVLLRDIRPWNFEEDIKYEGNTYDCPKEFEFGFLVPTNRGMTRMAVEVSKVGHILKHAKLNLKTILKLPILSDDSFQLTKLRDLDEEHNLFDTFIEYGMKGSDGYDGSTQNWSLVRSKVISDLVAQNLIILYKISLQFASGAVDATAIGRDGNFTGLAEFQLAMPILQKFTEKHLIFWVVSMRANGNLLTSMDKDYSRNEIKLINAERQRLFQVLLQKMERSRRSGTEEVSMKDLADALFALHNDLQVVKGLLRQYTA